MSAQPAVWADVVGFAELRPDPVPSVRPRPERWGAGDPWPAYRFAEPPGSGLFPRARLRKLKRAQALAFSSLKLAVDAASFSWDPAEVAVCVGTAWGEFDEELAFLETMIRRGEIGARPALLANSVHNVIASKIAIEYGFQRENHTFTHNASSFELALWQSLALLRAGRAAFAVTCAADALADYLELRGHLFGLASTDPTPLDPLSEPGRAGTLPGEGGATFLLGAGERPRTERLARLLGVDARGPGAWGGPAAQHAWLSRVVEHAGLTWSDLDLIILGANGDAELDARYRSVMASLAPSLAPTAAFASYRHLTGDFATASTLGLAAAVRSVFAGTMVAELRCLGGTTPQAPERVLLYHLTRAGHYSAMVLCR